MLGDFFCLIDRHERARKGVTETDDWRTDCTPIRRAVRAPHASAQRLRDRSSVQHHGAQVTMEVVIRLLSSHAARAPQGTMSLNLSMGSACNTRIRSAIAFFGPGRAWRPTESGY